MVDKALIKYKVDREEAYVNKMNSVFRDVWRSKGFFWIAGNKKEFYAW